ncbi:magnesium transporter [Mycolicibacterium hippocampi]|uniref:Magnesium transporter MgtE n=1 Tax=Mycolicibacterium hippocampi TaxID=659824 RepID=A0A7I9ZGC6_9MYCO|nr:magnesium transporter [Mycolicibacterium hippocampi]GFH00071.1 magnesium transporter MgtE [Mycolicibacterium hippocampi]
MTDIDESVPESTVKAIERAVDQGSFPELAAVLDGLPTGQLVEILERLDRSRRAIAYRILPKHRALEAFEILDATLQRDLVSGLQDEQTTELFAALDPDDRVELLDELPASVARRLLQGLPAGEREMTAEILGYPHGSIGRRMSPEFVRVLPETTTATALTRLADHLDDAETIYTLPVTDDDRALIGVVSLRDLLKAPPGTTIAEVQQPAQWVHATDDAETAARRCADLKLLALPVVDNETRIVGILTVDDALSILETADSEDQARISGVEPLRRPYLSAPVLDLMRSRIVWLLVLAVGATLTVQVLEVFEETLAEVVTLALFIPLLIGTGGNTGNQAATTVTRALALGDVKPRDVGKVLFREFRVGLSLGLALGALAFLLTSAIYSTSIGTVIGLTFVALCTIAATVGGVMPLVARAVRADPAVFANPFISTFIDASGLLIYFFIAKAVLGI